MEPIDTCGKEVAWCSQAELPVLCGEIELEKQKVQLSPIDVRSKSYSIQLNKKKKKQLLSGSPKTLLF